jgi:methylated-DNA-[protein]-cysteine S-methyltransferase
MGLMATVNGVRADISRIVLPRPSRRAVGTELARYARAGREARGYGRAADGIGDKLHLFPGAHGVLRRARVQIVEFFSGKRKALDIPLDLSAGTAFQRRVWRAICAIPYGRARSYRWVAARVGGPAHARAVGLALGANPVPIVVPCHRVVASDSSLGGFTGGLRMKRRLLALEGTLPLLKS